MNNIERLRKIAPFYNLFIIVVVGTFLIYTSKINSQNYFDKDIQNILLDDKKILYEVLKELNEPILYNEKPAKDIIRFINFNKNHGITVVRIEKEEEISTFYTSAIFDDDFKIKSKELRESIILSDTYNEVYDLIYNKNITKFTQKYDESNQIWIIETIFSSDYNCIFRQNPKDIFDIVQKLLYIGKYEQ